MEWAQVIVILLFICLALFALAAFALIVMLIRLTIQIRSLMKSAHVAAENLSQAAAGAGGAVQLVTLIKALRERATSYSRRRKGGKNE